MKFQLRPYQITGFNQLKQSIINGATRPIFCLPTGGGKTVVFSHIAESAQKKGSVVGVVCHRDVLIKQAKKTMKAYGINPLMIHYGMVQTYVRSPHKIPPMDLCIIDECHLGNFRKFIDLLPEKTQVIGFTATPLGASKKKPLRDTFDKVIAPVQINDLINEGFLSKPVYHIWEVDESQLKKDTKGEYTTSSQGKVFHLDDLKEAYNQRIGKTIIFTSSINQTIEIKEMFPECFAVHSKMSDKQKELIVEQYTQTPNACIVNCGILTAGFDDPTIKTVIVYRATTSIALWLQMVGRGSRVIPGQKDTFYIFDMGGNRKRLLPWECDRDWPAIFDLQGRSIKENEAAMKRCVSCEAVIYASQLVCPYCQATQPVKQKINPKAAGVTVINAYSDLPQHLNKDYSTMSVDELIERAAYGSPQTGRPYKTGWIIMQIKQRHNKTELLHEYARIKGYKSGWIHRHL